MHIIALSLSARGGRVAVHEFLAEAYLNSDGAQEANQTFKSCHRDLPKPWVTASSLPPFVMLSDFAQGQLRAANPL